MKIAVMLYAFHGGAAKSLMQYVNILINEGHEVLVEGSIGAKSIASAYLELGAIVKEFDNDIYDKRKVKGLIWVGKMAKYALDWKPDCIIAVGLQLSYYMSIIANKYNIKFLSIIPGGKLKSGSEKFSYMNCEHMIVFSQENKQEIEQYNFRGDITVISNRIPEQIDETWKEKYRNHRKDKFKLFIASRIDNDKINSLKYAIDITKELTIKKQNVILDIAGEGVAEKEIKAYVDATNKELKKTVINFLGFQDNVQQRYMDADICFGKGRCVLEPAMLGRYIACISEDGKCSIAMPETYDNLCFYNFSGREIQNESSILDIMEFMNEIGKEENVERFEIVKERILNDYSAEKLYEKFYSEFYKKNFIDISNTQDDRKCKTILSILVCVFLARVRLL